MADKEQVTNLNIDDLEFVDDDPDYVKITAKEVVDRIKELKEAGDLEGGVGIGTVVY